MKQNNIIDTNVEKLAAQNLENLFSVYQNDDGSYYYNLLKTVNFPTDLDPNLYFDYEVEPSDTWPLIAWKTYKDVRLWWVICSCNQIENPIAQPAAGTTLKLLYNNVVRDILAQLKQS